MSTSTYRITNTVIMENKNHLSLDLLRFIYEKFKLDIPINTKGGQVAKGVYCVLEAKDPHQIQKITELLPTMVRIIAESSKFLAEEDCDMFNGVCASVNTGHTPLEEVYFLYHGNSFVEFMQTSPCWDVLDFEEINQAFAKIKFWAAPANNPNELTLITHIPER